MSEESGETVGVVETSRIEEEIDYPTFEDAYEYYEEEDEWYGINMVGRDQHEEKGAKYDREDGFYTETNDMLGMIDSGAAVTVCGSEWIEKWLPSSTPRKWQLSSKVFRFGDGRKVQSNGWAILHALLSNTKNSHGVVLRLKTDIVPGTLPLLISFSSLRLMKCTVDFENLALVRRNATTPLLMAKSGHVFVHMKPIESGLWNDTQQLQVDNKFSHVTVAIRILTKMQLRSRQCVRCMQKLPRQVQVQMLKVRKNTDHRRIIMSTITKIFLCVRFVNCTCISVMFRLKRWCGCSRMQNDISVLRRLIKHWSHVSAIRRRLVCNAR